MRVYLVRHGQTTWNAEQRAQGHTDIPLDGEGQEQARLLANAFDNRPFTRILTSDLGRARTTAAPLAERHEIEPELRPDLRERSFGDWEGEPFEVIATNFTEMGLLSGLPRDEIRPPGGESQLDVWNRLSRVVEDILGAHEPVVVVSHGGTCSLLLARLVNATHLTARAFRFDNTGITTIARRPDGGFNLLQYNDTAHLRQAALSGSVDGTVR
jgi:probable phosphoglycerate mutase